MLANMAWNRNEALWWASSQNFSKLIAIKNGFSEHYISTPRFQHRLRLGSIYFLNQNGP